ncbi:Rho GTPase activation protein [Xylaria sp. FL0043]|nr:Rho GTPase activation protein [Xylaria sp. FL0043]
MMADPLSVAASVLGIVSAAAKISTVLAGIVKKAHDAPNECRKLQLEVDDIGSVLGQLQQFLLSRRRAPRSRTSLILVDQVIATLAACVTTFSELDTFTEALQSESDLNLLDRLRWVSKESELKTILMRIESHKSSLNLMLMILTCQKQEEAEDQVDHLCQLVQKVLETNTILAQRLGAWEETPIETSNRTGIETVTIEASHNDQDLSCGEPGDAPILRSVPWTRGKRGFAFEEVLKNSRAYRNVSLDNSDAFSIISSAGRTGSWSMLSGLSLSETSHIGILAIPIYETDIANKEAYDFNPPPIEPSSRTPKHTNKTSTRRWLKDLIRSDRPQQQQPSRIFGVPIDQSIPLDHVPISLIDEDGLKYTYGYVPRVVAKIGIFIKDKGKLIEDIFAISGNPARVLQLQTVFDTPPRYGAGFNWDGYTPHDVAALLLRYLKMLPEPIIPYHKHNDFINIPGSTLEATGEDLIKAISVAQQHMASLPPFNRHLLLYILDILDLVEDWSSVNKMTLERLTAAFQPAILAAPPAEMDKGAYFNAARVVIFLIKNKGSFITGQAT